MIATFILSSGRCGTQWIADTLRAAYGDVAACTHEPLGIRYHPRKLLGARDPRKIEGGELILHHARRIEEHLDLPSTTPPFLYIETGWPCFPAIPYFAERFRGRVRFVHLSRHPVYSASSMVTHGYYDRRNPGLIGELALLTPFDEGIRFNEYRDIWADLSPFEKCLYFWAEVNAFGLEQRADIDAPWLSLRFEDLFSTGRAALESLIAFLKLPERAAVFDAIGQNKDSFKFRSDDAWDSGIIYRHPKFIEVANSLGYENFDVDVEVLKRKYTGNSSKRMATRDGRILMVDESAADRLTRPDDPCPCGSRKKYKSCHGADPL